MHAAFVLPPASSAGGAYARRLSAAMRTAGHRAELIETADPAGAVSLLAPSAVPVVDGLLLPAFAGHAAAWPARAVALVHHPGGADAAAERTVLAFARGAVASSEPAAARLAAEFRVDPARLAVIEPGVDDAPRIRPAPGPCRIVSIGALTARKGHDVLLAALARLHDLEWTIAIAGDATRDPTHLPALVAQAEAAGIAGRVRILPDPDDHTIDALWEGAGLFALATRQEGYPAAVAQALRRGVPVATTDAVGKLVLPRAGILVPPGDADLLSKGLRRMIFDAGLRAAMADAAWTAGQALAGWADQARRFVDAVAALPAGPEPRGE